MRDKLLREPTCPVEMVVTERCKDRSFLDVDWVINELVSAKDSAKAKVGSSFRDKSGRSRHQTLPDRRHSICTTNQANPNPNKLNKVFDFLLRCE